MMNVKNKIFKNIQPLFKDMNTIHYQIYYGISFEINSYTRRKTCRL